MVPTFKKNDIVGYPEILHIQDTYGKNVVQNRWEWHAMHGEMSIVYNIDAGPI